MKTLFRVLSALAALVEEFVVSGGVEVLIDTWRARREAAEARARLDEERRLASALARGDVDTVESAAHRLLVAAERSNSSRRKASGFHRPGSRNSDGNNESLGGSNENVAEMQREIDQLLS